MEANNINSWSNIIIYIISAFLAFISFFFLRIIKNYDKQFSELFERTKDLPAIREAIEWIKSNLWKNPQK